MDDDDDERAEKGKLYTEFECPDCNAHNPVNDGFEVGGEVQCFYCGTEFKVTTSGSRLKFKSL